MTRVGKYVVIGDLCVDVFMQVEAYPDPGGDGTVQQMHQFTGGSAANTAMALAKLGGTPVLLTHTGKDKWADQVIPTLAEAGVMTSNIQQDADQSTGLTFLVVSEDAERTMFTYRGANRSLKPEEINQDLLTGIDFIHISSYACLTAPQSDAVLKAVALAQKNDIRVALDIGVEPASKAREVIQQILPKLALLILGESEALQLTQTKSVNQAIAVLLNLGVGLIALKMGDAGCRLISSDQDMGIPGFHIQAIDSTGAGDAFCAGMIHGLTHSWPLIETGKLANSIGAISATRWGAGENLPDINEIIEFLRSRSENHDHDQLLALLQQKTGTSSTEETA